MVGGSLSMREIFGLVERIAPTEATVLIEGETGTGKELVARTHPRPVAAQGQAVRRRRLRRGRRARSSRASCSATRRAPSPARRRRGRAPSSWRHGGTIFLDELGELSLDLQPKLLRVLEQREIRRVGGNRTIKVDVRVVAATKQDLRKEVQKGKFREDLYFRLSVVPIDMPPLRERNEDIPLIVRNFLAAAWRRRAARRRARSTRRR